MTKEEEFLAQNRELQHRLREVRTENAELKVQYRRWLILATGISVCSLFLSAVVVMWSPDKVELTDLIQGIGVDIAHIEEEQPIEAAGDIDIDEFADENTLAGVSEPMVNDIEMGLEPPEFMLTEVEEPKKVEKKVPVVVVKTEEPKTSERKFTLPKTKRKRVILYKVKRNDTLSDIAIQHFGAYRYVKKIKKDNGLRSDMLHQGMELKIILD